MNITGSRDGKVFFIDNDKVMIDGKMYYEKPPQNLPKADAYSLLADVRAMNCIKCVRESIQFEAEGDRYHNLQTADGLYKAVKIIDKYLSEHFS